MTTRERLTALKKKTFVWTYSCTYTVIHIDCRQYVSHGWNICPTPRQLGREWQSKAEPARSRDNILRWVSECSIPWQLESDSLRWRTLWDRGVVVLTKPFYQQAPPATHPSINHTGPPSILITCTHHSLYMKPSFSLFLVNCSHYM